uniref:Uncharacterized protein n=1 Tax=Bostrychia tenella TaxID=324755 RepID=A0A1Z1M557_9FLOR|nr:hypothetical protein [Bostrychia tenella]ARW61197.1 hypothetical protein [Bostrychia tenella]
MFLIILLVSLSTKYDFLFNWILRAYIFQMQAKCVI